MCNNFTKSGCVQKISATILEFSLFLVQHMYFSWCIQFNNICISVIVPLLLNLYVALALYTWVVVRFSGSLSFNAEIMYLGAILYLVMSFTNFFSSSFRRPNMSWPS